MNAIPNVSSSLRVIVLGLLAAAAGGVLLGLGLWLEPDRARHAYLAGFAGVAAVSLGGLVLLMIVHAMDAKWPVVVRRPIEAVVAPLPLLVLAFVPVALWIPELYSWAHPVLDTMPEHAQQLLAHKRPWLRQGWMIGRTALDFACWLAIGLALLRLSHRQDPNPDGRPDPRLVRRARAIAVAGLPLVALTLTLAAFDWLMSLDPLWVSTIFGLYYFAGGFCGAAAVVVLVVAALDRPDHLGPLLRPSHYSALGRVLLTAIALWGYFAYFQLLLVWIANRPDEVAWYLDRTRGGWVWVAVALALLHLPVPLVALLSYRLKRRRRPLSIVAAGVVLAHVIDVHWLVMPRAASDWPLHWVDPAGWLLVGGLAVAWSAFRLRGRAVAPRHDPRLPEGARYESA